MKNSQSRASLKDLFGRVKDSTPLSSKESTLTCNNKLDLSLSSIVRKQSKAAR